MLMNIHRFIDVTIAEGPGKRFVLWVQGCSIRCKGCGVPWTWNPKRGNQMDITEIMRLIEESKQKHQIEGVTILGGEPFDQKEALLLLVKEIKKINLSVMLFSGYYMEKLRDDSLSVEILQYVDLLIDGPFEEEQLDLSRPWVGSSNQQYRFLTETYKEWEDLLHLIPNKVEIRILSDGTISVNGMITQKSLKELTNLVGYQNSK